MKNIIYELKELKGFALGIGHFDDKFLNEIMKNDYLAFTILSNDSLNIPGKKSSKFINNEKNKSIDIKKLKKKFKKNKPDYMIIDIKEVNDYLKFFVKDSLYITKEKIYIYSSDKNIDLNNIYKLYKRYNNNIIISGKYIIIEQSLYRNKIFKNILYYIKDTIVNVYNAIGNLIAS